MNLLGLILIAVCAVVPVGYVAAAAPVLWLVQHQLLPQGGAVIGRFTVADVVMVLLLMKTLLGLLNRREAPDLEPLYGAAIVYVGVNVLSSMAAGVKFGDGTMGPSLTSLARFVIEFMVVPILAYSVTTRQQAQRCLVIVLVTLAVLAGIQFINFVGASHGIMIGEVQGMERGEVRYFGPVGDSIGVVLLLGYMAALCFGNLLATGIFFAGIGLTAGIGALLAVGVGTVLYFVLGRGTAPVRPWGGKRPWLVPLVLAVVFVGVAIGGQPLLKPMFSRLGAHTVSQSANQRSASARMATTMIADNPVLGVGYMGYQRALEHYGGNRYFDLNRLDGGTANANNQYLQSLADAGVVGLLAAGCLVFAAARLLWRTARQNPGFVGTFYFAAFLWLLAQVIGNQAAVWLAPSCYVGRFLWVTCGLALAIERLPAESPAMEPVGELVTSS